MATDRLPHSRSSKGGKRPVRMLVALLLSLATAGCVGQGLIYTRTVSPYSLDFDRTPIGSKTCRVNEYSFKEPVSGAGVSVIFTSRVVEDAAREAGMTNFYCADVDTFSVLLGIYEKKTLVLYGD